jgi:hypothetical protein
MLNTALFVLCTIAALMLVYRVQNMTTLPRWLGGSGDDEGEALDLQMLIVFALIVVISTLVY